jgi:hypothetical protein
LKGVPLVDGSGCIGPDVVPFDDVSSVLGQLHAIAAESIDDQP